MNRCNEKRHTHLSFFARAARAAREIRPTSRARADGAGGSVRAICSRMKLRAATQPYWIGSTTFPRFPKLERDEAVDVAVVGAGITGLTAAFLLLQEGRSVALVERDRCAEIDTGHTSAHLTMVTDRGAADLVKAFGRDHAQAAWDAGLAAI